MERKVIDLFSGCGGISLGFKLAGFEIVGALDNNADSLGTFKLNFPSARIYCGDIENLSNGSVRRFFGVNTVDVIVGGPPCQGFSNANRYKKPEEDPRNRLFAHFLRLVRVLKPRAVMIENVRGMLTKDDGYVRGKIHEELGRLGYSVDSRLLNASDYGVPQKRIRAFFVGVKGKRFSFDDLAPAVEKCTVRDAIGDLYNLEGSDFGKLILQKRPQTDFQRFLRREDNMVFDHEVRYPAKIVQKRISFVPQGGNWRDVPKSLWPSNRDNRHSSAYKRLKEDDVSVTIDTGNAHSNYFHPVHNRLPSVREAARLQSFPDSFVFAGTRSSKYRQVGNAVPPLLAKTVALKIKDLLDER